jgi:hypothetical protein
VLPSLPDESVDTTKVFKHLGIQLLCGVLELSDTDCRSQELAPKAAGVTVRRVPEINPIVPMAYEVGEQRRTLASVGLHRNGDHFWVKHALYEACYGYFNDDHFGVEHALYEACYDLGQVFWVVLFCCLDMIFVL